MGVKEYHLDSYWKSQAGDFTKHYTDIRLFNLRYFISRFLNKRSSVIVSLIGLCEDKIILDVGCGPGEYMKLLANRCKKIIGIDYSEQMLSEAKKTLAKLPKNNWELSLANAEQLPFPNKTFDIIINIGLLDYVSSPKHVLLECQKKLNKRGVIIFTIPKNPSLFFFLRGLFGTIIRKKLLKLPKINNKINRKELNSLLRKVNLCPIYIGSLWTTMWIVKAKRE